MIKSEEYNLSNIEIEKQQDFKTEAMPHQDALYNYALMMAKNTDDAQDLVQETYYKAYRSYHQFENASNSKA